MILPDVVVMYKRILPVRRRKTLGGDLRNVPKQVLASCCKTSHNLVQLNVFRKCVELVNAQVMKLVHLMENSAGIPFIIFHGNSLPTWSSSLVIMVRLQTSFLSKQANITMMVQKSYVALVGIRRICEKNATIYYSILQIVAITK